MAVKYQITCKWVTQGAKLFRCLEKTCRSGAKLLPQSRFFGLCRGQMPLLDRPVSTDFFRNCRKRDGDMVVSRPQPLQQLLEQLFIVGDQTALGLALGRIAEKIECGAA